MADHSTVSTWGEYALIQHIADSLAQQALPAGWVGIGDDAAVTALSPGMRALTTTDVLVEGLHFRRETASAEDIGWKAMAVNLSDIAGMGGIPRWATVSLALPSSTPVQWVADFYRGARELAGRFETPIVGGDTVGSPGPVMVTITVVGEASRPLLRTGARPGDLVVVTGPLGASAAGLWMLEEAIAPNGLTHGALQAHRRPAPHLAQGHLLSHVERVAVLDNSDGLARSAAILAQANRLQVVLEAERIPIAPSASAVARRAGVNPLQWALYGGEDYTLVAAMSAKAWEHVEDREGFTVVGRCDAGPPAVLLERDGRSEPLNSMEFRHF